jgi:hypothetical protein
MQKIPVGPTIAFAYRFLIREIGIVVGICWVPAVLYAGVNYLTHLYAMENRELLDANDPQTAGAYFVLSIFSLAVTLYASSMVAIAITRQVMGHERPPGVLLLYFAAGRSEWRMLGANIRFLLAAGALIFIAALVSLAAFLIAGTPLKAPEQMLPTAANIAAGLVAWGALIYAFVSIVQMGFLLPATVTMEEKGGLRRAHELAKGNVWRVLAIVAALGLPILLLILGAEAAILRSALGPNFASLAPSDFFEKAGQAMEQKLGAWQAFSAIVFVLGSGLIYSGAAFAYRARTSDAH